MYERPKKHFKTATFKDVKLANVLMEVTQLKKKHISTRIHIWKELRMRAKKSYFGNRRTFEVSVINLDVLNALKNNEEHPIYNDRWAEVQRTVIFAMDEIELSEKISLQYPSVDGFVVQKITEYPRAHLI